MRETKKKSTNELKLIYNEYAENHTTEHIKKEPAGRFKIVGARLAEADIVDFYGRCTPRHSFASTEGEYLYLKISCEPGVNRFAKLWDKNHNISTSTSNGPDCTPHLCELLTKEGENRIAYIKIRIQDEPSVIYGKTVYISVSVGTTEVYKDIYSITISEFTPEKLNLSFFKHAFTLSPEHNNCYTAFKQGETHTIGISALCHDVWKEDFYQYHSLLEYEMVITDESGKILESDINNLLKYTYNHEVLEPEHLTAQYYISDVSHYRIGTYVCTIYFMGRRQFEMEFAISENEEKGWPTARISQKELKTMIKKPSSEAMKKLEELIGLDQVKKDIKTHLNYVQLMKAREKAGLKHGKRILNMVFSGEAGTGKTTVCRLLGSLLKDIGILSSGHVVEANRESLLGQYIGETEKRTKAVIEKAMGGVLFIDEAYSLTSRNEDDKDFGRYVIDTLMTYLSEPDNDLIVVLAGYSKEMSKLLDCNPGLASRFPIRYEFPNYTPAELLQMAKLYFKTYDYEISEEVCEKMSHLFEQAVNVPNFGNGRYAKTLIENTIIPNMANRIADAGVSMDDVSALSRIIPADIPDENTFSTKSEERRKIGFNPTR